MHAKCHVIPVRYCDITLSVDAQARATVLGTCVHVVGDVLPELDARGHVHLQRALPRDGHRRGAVELIDVQELNQVADDEVDQGDRSGADTTTPTYNMNNVSKGGPYAAAVL